MNHRNFFLRALPRQLKVIIMAKKKFAKKPIIGDDINLSNFKSEHEMQKITSRHLNVKG